MNLAAIKGSAERILSEGIALALDRTFTTIINRISILCRTALGGPSGAEVEQVRRQITYMDRAQKVALVITGMATLISTGVLLREVNVPCRPAMTMLAFPITSMGFIAALFSGVATIQQAPANLVCGAEDSPPIAAVTPIIGGIIGLAAYKCLGLMKHWMASDVIKRNGGSLPFEIRGLF